MEKNSECRKPGWLHDFQITEEVEYGLIERCSRCGLGKLFRFDMPDRLYLSYHLRSALQPWQPRYDKEYNQR